MSHSGEEQKAPPSAIPKQLKFYKVDLHTHILPESLPERFSNWMRLDCYHPKKARMYKGNEFFREIEENCYRMQPRVDDCDEHGVHVQVLSTVPVMFNYQAKAEECLDLSRLLNDHIAAIVKQKPERFVGLGTIPMQDPDLAVKELERCVNELGMAGIQIGSHIEQWPLSDKRFFPIWEAAERLGACIFVHPWDMVGQELMKKYWLPWLVGMPAESSFAICSLIFGGVFERFPNLRFAFAHGGGSFPGTVGRIQHGFDVRPDLCAVDCHVAPRDFLGRFWVDSLVHDPEALKNVIKICGENKVALGSDYPFPLGEAIPGRMVEEHTDLSPQQKHKILWKNGIEFLGVKEDTFLKGEELQQLRAREKEWNASSSSSSSSSSSLSSPSSSPSVVDSRQDQ